MLDESYKSGQKKALGQDCYIKIINISRKQSQLAAEFENKTQVEKKQFEQKYCIEQMNLEKDKLDLMGIIQ